jgi:hypothetical protein
MGCIVNQKFRMTGLAGATALQILLHLLELVELRRLHLTNRTVFKAPVKRPFYALLRTPQVRRTLQVLATVRRHYTVPEVQIVDITIYLLANSNNNAIAL